jgi:hypothetical protein
MFEKEAEEYGIASREICADVDDSDLIAEAYKDGAEFGYNEGFKDCAKSRLNVTTISDCPIKDEEESKYKTAYIKGIRTMANALKDYDRTDGAWTDYFEHTVEKVLNRLLKEGE